MVYLNNAATSYPKPDAVINAWQKAIRELPSGQFRSSADADGADILSCCRKRLGRLLGIADTDRIYFTSGSTEGLNAIIAGLGIEASRIITTATEHNSVLRPLYNLPGIGGSPFLLPCDENGTVSPESLEEKAKNGDFAAFILNHCSNVTGAIQDAGAFGEIAKRYGLIYILDVSQSAGCLEIKADEWGVDVLAFTGHKSLMGPQGTGGYYVRDGIKIRPLKYGGTGFDSSRLLYDEDTYEYEAGTLNIPGIEVLSEALRWVLDTGVDNIRETERQLTDCLISELEKTDGIRLFGKDLKDRGPVVSFTSGILPPSDIAYILQNSFGIVTRAGLHCAPLIHDHIGSGNKGTLRVSFSYFNEKEDVDALVAALREMA